MKDIVITEKEGGIIDYGTHFKKTSEFSFTNAVKARLFYEDKLLEAKNDGIYMKVEMYTILDDGTKREAQSYCNNKPKEIKL